MNKRSDFGDKADGWFAALDEPIAPLATDLRALIRKAVPNANECIKWGTPNYEKDGPICVVRTAKGFAALQFGQIGTSLKDPDGLLEGTGKAMRYVKIRSKSDLKRQVFTSWIKQAAKANLK